MKKIGLIAAILFSSFSCKKDNTQSVIKDETKDITLFSLVNPSKSNINFSNNLKESYQFNFLAYPYIYIGGGVAVGDINNDGLQDIYFTSNQNSNILYLNKGDFQFENITTSANVSDDKGWTTGTSMIDINNDGYLDIYVCKSASLNNPEQRRNKLYINQKNNTFKESAKQYGLDHHGFSTQSYFFDYDKDGDLDMYLVNHRPDFKNNSKISVEIQRDIQEESSDQLFRNDGSTFSKVSAPSGILNKSWGLSASVGDFNNDNWPDIYIANDYLEPDILYINNKNGTFKNEVLDRMKHISFNSMGSDFADINNDLLPDLLVLDMLAEDHSRGKENMATMSTKNFNSMVVRGYHHQYMSNVLQLNNGNGNFSEIAQLSGISKTDWSWAPLIADYDNDGYKDIFITNGIEKDLGNQDFRKNLLKLNQAKQAIALEDVLNMAPAEKLANYIYKNNGDLTFTNYQQKWGLHHKVNSNGAAYADFDNDGDLDLIINNENDIASLYKNNSTNNYLSLKLTGNKENKLAIGSKVKITTSDGSQIQELYLNRGFQSSVSNVLNFGVGNAKTIDVVEITWPNGTVSTRKNIKSNQVLTIDTSDASRETVIIDQNQFNNAFNLINNKSVGIDYKHKENRFDDYSKQLLLPQKQSTQGPSLSVADVNGDNLDDFYVGGAVTQTGELYIQNTDGTFSPITNNSFTSDKNHEDIASLFFDADNDNDLDLYVCSGGYEFNEKDVLLQDRLYLNDGHGNFTKSNNLPSMLTSTKTVKPLDYDNDGDLDLIVGGSLIPGKYPLAPESYILENTNGKFKDVTSAIAPELKNIGMVNDIEIVKNSDSIDLLIVGQWMPITLFSLENGKFLKQDIPEFNKTEGWYHSVVSSDFDNDGDLDYIVGNIGGNNKFSPKANKPLHVFSSDFDNNGTYDLALSKYYKGQLVPVRGKECSSEQTPFLNEKIGSYKEFGSLNMEGVYGNEAIENANHLMAYNFKSLYIENNGANGYKITHLPNEAQISATQDFEIIDINNDGYKDVIGVGNLYDAEVETIRYDAARGYVLLNDTKGGFEALKNHNLFCDKDMRATSFIKIGGANHLIIASNNSSLSIYKILK